MFVPEIYYNENGRMEIPSAVYVIKTLLFWLVAAPCLAVIGIYGLWVYRELKPIEVVDLLDDEIDWWLNVIDSIDPEPDEELPEPPTRVGPRIYAVDHPPSLKNLKV